VKQPYLWPWLSLLVVVLKALDLQPLFLLLLLLHLLLLLLLLLLLV
jgi:hypothetical protein